jgi:Big-like domain-containing protein/cysteine-rich secretory family protein
LLKPAPPARALPRIARASLRAFAHAPKTVHVGVGILLATIIGAGALVANDVTTITATPPSPPVVPLTRAAFTAVVTTGMSLDDPLTVRFSTPMDRASVAAALRVRPAQDVDLAWDTSGRTLTIVPSGAWLPDTLHSVVVDPGALAENGRPLVKPVRAAFLTRSATDGRIEPTRPHDKRVTTDTAFTITFSRPVTTASVVAGLRVDPVMDGTIAPTTWQPDGTSFTFTPRKRLPADTQFTLSLAGVRTVDGEVLAPMTTKAQTVTAPSVVRIRPKKDETGVARNAKISVRFSMPMDEATTRDAFSVKVNGKTRTGRISFAKGGKLLVFKPKKPMPYRARVTVTVGAGATSEIGTPIDKGRTVRFRVERKPKPVLPPTGGGGGGGSTAIGTGGSGGGGSWAAVERYYLGLMNCTRTGGWVTSSGSCSSPGGRNVAPLQLDAGISSAVSRPYARLLATSGQCSHYANGGPDDRLRRAGYTNYTWGENIGCRAGNPYASVLGTHLFYQSERSYNGGHYRNLMDPDFSRVGIGVWVSGGRVRLVIDFYHP